MSSLPETYFTVEEYLEREERSETRHEYLAGHIFDMAGSTPQHNRITVNVSSALNVQLRGRPCQVFSIDARVRVPATTLYTYPDVAVVCGEVEVDEQDPNAITNPQVIVEVLSPSTEGYDRGDKFAHYRLIEGMTDYLLISQDKVRIEHYAKQSDHQWLLTVLEKPEEAVELASVGCVLTLSEVFDKVALANRK